MDDSSVEIVTHQATAGDRIRKIADQLKQETSLQIKATSRILAAAAQISENHDRLIEEVVEMVEEDLDQESQADRSSGKQDSSALIVKSESSLNPSSLESLGGKSHSKAKEQEKITVESLKQQFKKLEQAKAHFGVKANSWALLADKLNQKVLPKSDESVVLQRLDKLEAELEALRTDVNQSLNFLAQILKKLS
ncbi:MAG: hypothetical protein MUC48_25325 [Leptolyngbya sp. Prado105]|jgi:hypothetical protein|nr:hypothetical protein [Leptolyngbya sp. Prado105]